MVSSAPRASPGFGGPAGPCVVGPKLKLSIARSRLAKRASETTTPSFTRRNASFVFSGVARLRVPRSSSLPQRPQFESSCSIASTCSKVVRWVGSWVEGCGAVGTGAAAGRRSCPKADRPVPRSKVRPTNVPAVSKAVPGNRVTMAFLHRHRLRRSFAYSASGNPERAADAPGRRLRGDERMDPYISSKVALDVEKTLFPVKPSLLIGGSALKLPWGARSLMSERSRAARCDQARAGPRRDRDPVLRAARGKHLLRGRTRVRPRLSVHSTPRLRRPSDH